MVKKTVLFIDNETELIESLTLDLIKEGYKVESVIRLGDALEKIVNQTVALIIVDIEISPECNIVSAIRKVNKTVPIITVTEDDSIETQIKVRQEGIFFYFVKPFTVEDMKVVIYSALNLKH